MFRTKVLFHLTIILVILATSHFLYGQSLTKKDPARPHVYLTQVSKSGNEITFRLMNNSNWAIRVCVQAFTPPIPVNGKNITLQNGQIKFAFIDQKQVQLCYGVDKTANFEKVVLSNRNDRPPRKSKSEKSGLENCRFSTCSIYVAEFGGEGWVASGNSVLFKIPSKYLAEDHGVYIAYKYEWEDSNYSPEYREAEHRAYFYDFQRRARSSSSP